MSMMLHHDDRSTLVVVAAPGFSASPNSGYFLVPKVAKMTWHEKEKGGKIMRERGVLTVAAPWILIVTPLLVVVERTSGKTAFTTAYHGSSTLGDAKGCLGSLQENSTSGDPKGSRVGGLDDNDDDRAAADLCQDPRGRDDYDLLRLRGISSPVQASQTQ
jgi:hypothetical protein